MGLLPKRRTRARLARRHRTDAAGKDLSDGVTRKKSGSRSNRFTRMSRLPKQPRRCAPVSFRILISLILHAERRMYLREISTAPMKLASLVEPRSIFGEQRSESIDFIFNAELAKRLPIAACVPC